MQHKLRTRHWQRCPAKGILLAAALSLAPLLHSLPVAAQQEVAPLQPITDVADGRLVPATDPSSAAPAAATVLTADPSTSSDDVKAQIDAMCKKMLEDVEKLAKEAEEKQKMDPHGGCPFHWLHPPTPTPIPLVPLQRDTDPD